MKDPDSVARMGRVAVKAGVVLGRGLKDEGSDDSGHESILNGHDLWQMIVGDSSDAGGIGNLRISEGSSRGVVQCGEWVHSLQPSIESFTLWALNNSQWSVFFVPINVFCTMSL